MKSVKIILLLAIISLFASVPYNATEARDCSNPKGFHQKLMCKVTGGKDTAVTSDDAESLKTKIEKKGDSFWKKLKSFGGENIGESD